jgi:hypothetical protein
VARVSSQSNQRQRTQSNPLDLGTFDDLTLRLLTGKLGPEYKVTADGYGGGTYNHWFKISVLRPAWIIATKTGPRPQYINVSFYDLNNTPIQGRNPFDNDSITDGRSLTTGDVYYPYLNTFMGAQSDLYNTYERLRLDRGDDRYFPLPAGSYLLCVSSTRNETIEYAIGLVVEFPITELLLALEDFTLYLQENLIDPETTVTIFSPVIVDTVISTDPIKPNGFTEDLCQIDPGVTVTVLNGSEWLIGKPSGGGTGAVAGDGFILETDNPQFLDSIHDHTLSEWREAWNRQHQETDRFPDTLIPLTNRP